MRFTPLSEGETRIDLEHRNLERFGDKLEDIRSRIDSPNGWTAILKIYAEAAGAGLQ